MPSKAAIDQSRQATLKALDLDKMLPEAHVMMAILRANEYEWKEAEFEFRRALELGPESAFIFSCYSFFYLVQMRRFDEAVEWLQKAIKLDPLSPLLQHELGFVYIAMRQYDRAIDQFRKTLELDPHFPMPLLFMSQCHIATGNLDEGGSGL
jgi:Tfp pilus assembly protein PilF